MTKRYLNVSYEDRDLAKRLGAKWDPSVRRWYCVCVREKANLCKSKSYPSWYPCFQTPKA